jgi:hypothetical protein
LVLVCERDDPSSADVDHILFGFALWLVILIDGYVFFSFQSFISPLSFGHQRYHSMKREATAKQASWLQLYIGSTLYSMIPAAGHRRRGVLKIWKHTCIDDARRTTTTVPYKMHRRHRDLILPGGLSSNIPPRTMRNMDQIFSLSRLQATE